MKFCITFLAFISFNCFANAPLSLNGVGINMSMVDVIKLKGEPTSKSEYADYITDIFTYPKFEVHFNGDDVVGVYSDSINICTPENICIGSRIQDAQALYGKGYSKSKGLYEFYSKQEFTCWYRVFSTHDYIQKIEIACQP